MFKYRDGRPLGRDLADFAWGALRGDEMLWGGLEGIIPVPLHRRRLWRRGFNQAAVLARCLAERSGVPLLEKHLLRRKDIPPQTSLASAQRLRNVAGAFAVRRPGDLDGRSLLLVDDVFTTGSTVGECCRVLRRAGADEVRALTLARAQG